MSTDPKTLAERLDAAQSGEEFHQVLAEAFAYVMETTRQRGSAAPVSKSGSE